MNRQEALDSEIPTKELLEESNNATETNVIVTKLSEEAQLKLEV